MPVLNCAKKVANGDDPSHLTPYIPHSMQLWQVVRQRARVSMSGQADGGLRYIPASTMCSEKKLRKKFATFLISCQI